MTLINGQGQSDVKFSLIVDCFTYRSNFVRIGRKLAKIRILSKFVKFDLDVEVKRYEIEENGCNAYLWHMS